MKPRSFRLGVVLDIDDTVFLMKGRWMHRIDEKFGARCARMFRDSVPRDISTAREAEFRNWCLQMDYDDGFHRGLGLVAGVREAIANLFGRPEVKFLGYLSARPEILRSVTTAELTRNGLKCEPLYLRGHNICRSDIPRWKFMELVRVQRNAGVNCLIYIDDDPKVIRYMEEQLQSNPRLKISVFQKNVDLFPGSQGKSWTDLVDEILVLLR